MTKQVFSAEGASLTVYIDAPNWGEHRAAAIGSFKCKSEADGQDVLQQAIAFVRSQGVSKIIGPMDGDTWHKYRFVTETDGSSNFLMEPSNATGDVEFFKQAGFKEISRYFSARVPVANAAKTAPDASDAITIENWNGADLEGFFGQVFELSTAAFTGNAFYKPISREDFMAMYMPMVPMLKSELIFFARNASGKLVGFLFGIPNYGEGPKPSSVILKTYASIARGAGRHLAYAFHRAALDGGYETAIHALIHDDNQSAQRSALEGAEIFRRYGLFGLDLND